ncbi:hypothetical protein SteCoe_33168 [Stentor coeruleus]|uniref:Glutathione S-transferase n=1 Tax=Stentor coeruleus TaxID=5963 RepID=A0A1R2AXB2_9CILI|nr:hypothetical protein SteCoe_33168 [Stentor coeruleus]
MSVEVYIDHFSPPSRAVIAFLVETNIPYVVKEIRLAKQEQLSKEYLEICPWGTVPAIVHNNIKIFESHAIMQYLANAFNVKDSWYPKSLSARSKVDIYLHWHHSNIRGLLSGYVYNKYIGPRFYGTKYNQDLNDMLLQAQIVSLDYLENVLENGYVAGTQEISIGDISCYCDFSQMLIVNHDFSKYKNITRWLNYMKELKGIKEAHKVFNKLLPKIKI